VFKTARPASQQVHLKRT